MPIGERGFPGSAVQAMASLVPGRSAGRELAKDDGVSTLADAIERIWRRKQATDPPEDPVEKARRRAAIDARLDARWDLRKR
jgi:hypothetical protein